MTQQPHTLGIFGGTFDPPHFGHLIVAAHVREAMHLDRIMFIPAAVPPHKRDREITPGPARLAMVQAAIEGDPRSVASDIELKRGGVSYTIDSIRTLRQEMRGTQFTVLMGMDNLLDFLNWKEPQAILQEASIAVMTRPGYTVGPEESGLLKQMHLCEVPYIGIAARDIRRRVADGRSIRYLVPDSVERYIKTHGLYRQ
jgi:nicotinate-nucleotide adenylyltransferase